MAQLNIHMTEQFAAALRRFMRLRGIRNKSEAVRVAVNEGLDRAFREVRPCDFTRWIGAGLKAGRNSRPKFKSHDDLWR